MRQRIWWRPSTSARIATQGFRGYTGIVHLAGCPRRSCSIWKYEFDFLKNDRDPNTPSAIRTVFRTQTKDHNTESADLIDSFALRKCFPSSCLRKYPTWLCPHGCVCSGGCLMCVTKRAVEGGLHKRTKIGSLCHGSGTSAAACLWKYSAILHVSVYCHRSFGGGWS